MFFCVLTFFLTLQLLFLSLKITVQMKKIKISIPKSNEKIFDNKYEITLLFHILGNLQIFKLIIDKNKAKNLKIKNKIKEKIKSKIKNTNLSKIKNSFTFNTNIIELLEKLKIKIEYINLTINIGTESAMATAYVVAIISSIIGVLLKKQITNSEESKFNINPVYINKNLLNLEFDCIFTVKMIHIIHIIYILNKKRRDDKNVRTSNRRSYGYSYE